VTYEIEKIALQAVEAAAAITPVRPSPSVLGVVQDRARQKGWLVAHGFPVGPYREVRSDSELAAAWELGPFRLKACRGGYDGRSQARVPSAEAAPAAWRTLGQAPCVAERELDLAAELSVLIARRPSGEVATFPAAQNWHDDGILSISVLPGALPEATTHRATEVARGIAEGLGVEGLLAVEFFVTRAGELAGDLYVNELAPRPHNTFHAAETACLTGQFEQLVRAICDLPLGSTKVLRPTALANLLGDLWLGPTPPALERALALPGVRLNLYGKAPRQGRKIGHLLAVADTAGEAVALVREALRLLGG
jgi:5-(carboxyamino)imidazole ribonucleotide synthase